MSSDAVLVAKQQYVNILEKMKYLYYSSFLLSRRILLASWKRYCHYTLIDTSDGTIYRIVSNIAILRSYRGISLSR